MGLIYLPIHEWLVFNAVYMVNVRIDISVPWDASFCTSSAPHMDVNNMPLKNLKREDFGASATPPTPPEAGDQGGNIFGNIWVFP